MARKAQHGGKRPGAGRPVANPEGPTIVVAGTVPESLVTRLKALAASKDWSLSEALTEAVRGLLAKHRK
jgi:hypothetical protein